MRITDEQLQEANVDEAKISVETQELINSYSATLARKEKIEQTIAKLSQKYGGYRLGSIITDYEKRLGVCAIPTIVGRTVTREGLARIERIQHDYTKAVAKKGEGVQ